MEERTFSKSEAWLDLMQSARFEESQATELIGGKLVSWSRGQLPASLRYLADRWKWSKNKVDDFLKMLEKEGMIQRIGNSGQTVVSLVNYSFYNPKGQQKGQENVVPVYVSADGGDSKGEMRGTAGGQAGDETNNINKEEECKQKFTAFQNWIKVKAENVGRMKKPFTQEEFMKLQAGFDSNYVSGLLVKMHNWKPLLTKNVSAYLTFLDWAARDRDSGRINGHTTPKSRPKEELLSGKVFAELDKK
jgi:hypothetical protein